MNFFEKFFSGLDAKFLIKNLRYPSAFVAVFLVGLHYIVGPLLGWIFIGGVFLFDP